VHPSSLPFITIAMPTLNEEKYIAECIRSLAPAEGAIDYELLVMDGGSIDRTVRIAEEIGASNPRIKVLANPRRIQSAAINIAAESGDPKSNIIIRADCHALYPLDFVEKCAATLMERNCASVVVSMRAVGNSPIQKAIAAAQNSRLGNGGSAHRKASVSGYVDHGHHAAFDRAVFQSLGGYDEAAPYNEDAEFDARLVRAGGRIYLDGRLTIDYFPRSTFASLARQYFRHGWGRANTIIKHAMRPRVRQLLPVLIFLASVISLAAWPAIGVLALLFPAAYIGACLAWGLLLAVRDRQPWLVLSGLAAVTMHMSWAVGFLIRCIEETARKAHALVHRRDLNGSKGLPPAPTHSD
jgi:succinoglycan biosynthesis protein ExoA